MLGVIRNLDLDFILYIVTAYVRNYSIVKSSAHVTTQNIISLLEEVS